MPLRIGIIGARCCRQGIGEHVARHLAALGGDVVAILGTRWETVEVARCQLQQRYGIDARGYTSLTEMLRTASLEALAICSPQECHLEHLQQALAAKAHVLCEKPLVFNPGHDLAADAAPLVRGFTQAGKVLMVNEQWPYTLRAFSCLFPDVASRPPRELRALLSPDAAGVEMVPNALPHVLSLLFALAPAGGNVEGIKVSALSRDAAGTVTAAQICLSYRHASRVTHVTAECRQVARQPRPAGYQIDGHAAMRRIELPGYTMHLEATSESCRSNETEIAARPRRRVAMEDPLRLLLADFLNACEHAQHGAQAKRDGTILQRLSILRDVYTAARIALAPSSYSPMRSVGTRRRRLTHG
jgi:predicted dehydrogenase